MAAEGDEIYYYYYFEDVRVCVIKNTHTRGSALLPGARGGDRPLGGLRRRPIRGATTRAPCKTVYYYNIVVVSSPGV